MEGRVLSTLIICYLFFGGAGAGTAFFLVLLDMRSPWASLKHGIYSASKSSSRHLGTTRALRLQQSKRYLPQKEYQWLFGYGYLISFVFLIVGIVCLLADLGRIDRVLLLFTLPTLSYVTIGTYALTLLAAAVFVLVCVWLSNAKSYARWLIRLLGALVILAAVLVMLYTGLLIQSMRTGFLTGSFLVTVLFVLSSLSLGVALILIVFACSSQGKRFVSTIKQLMNVDLLLIVLEAVSAIALIIYGLITPSFSGTAEAVLTGQYAMPFWLGFILCGIIAPFIFETSQHISRARLPLGQLSLLSVSASILIGGFCLRWLVVMAV